ncbi:MAG: hypothetical protein WAU39_20250 [Polyangiales bacterium]
MAIMRRNCTKKNGHGTAEGQGASIYKRDRADGAATKSTHFRVKVGKDSERVIDYTVRYTW